MVGRGIHDDSKLFISLTPSAFLGHLQILTSPYSESRVHVPGIIAQVKLPWFFFYFTQNPSNLAIGAAELVDINLFQICTREPWSAVTCL